MLERLRRMLGDEDGPAAAAPPPAPEPIGVGTRVRIGRAAEHPLAGATGEVVRISGRSVVVRMDEPYEASGVTQRLFYSYPGELEVARRVGRLGDVDLYDETGA
jgi:hypothetical protein